MSLSASFPSMAIRIPSQSSPSKQAHKDPGRWRKASLISKQRALFALLALCLYLGFDWKDWPRQRTLYRRAPWLASKMFTLSIDPLPVYEDDDRIYFNNTPISIHRPIAQFRSRGSIAKAMKVDPVVAVMTATQNPRPELLWDTYHSLAEQSLQLFRWIIVDDHTDDAASREAIDTLASIDRRIVVLRDPESRGLASSRNVALDYIMSLGLAPYIVPLDDDDLFEFTALEKAVWMLESNPQWDIASYFFVKFGAQNLTERRGMYLGDVNYYTVCLRFRMPTLPPSNPSSAGKLRRQCRHVSIFGARILSL